MIYTIKKDNINEAGGKPEYTNATIFDIPKIVKNEYNKYKKKKQEQNKKTTNTSSSQTPKLIAFTSEEKREITKSIKAIVRKYNTDPKLKQKMIDMLNHHCKYESADKWGWDGKFHRLTCELFSDSDDYFLHYSIQVNGNRDLDIQTFNVATVDLRIDICKELENQISYIKANGDYGDGDEGIVEITKNKET